MSIVSFDELLQRIRNDISGSDTNMSRCAPSEERLAVTLRQVQINLFILAADHSDVDCSKEWRD
jgi:hypothetical protein